MQIELTRSATLVFFSNAYRDRSRQQVFALAMPMRPSAIEPESVQESTRQANDQAMSQDESERATIAGELKVRLVR